MAVTLVVPPQARSVSLVETKRHLRIETPDDDEYLESLIDAAIAHVEAVAGMKLITQTWRQHLDCLTDGAMIRLFVEPVQSIPAMRIYDADGNAAEISPADLELDQVSSPPRLVVENPPSPGRTINGIEIDIIAGFGDTPADVPDSLRRALLLLIAHSYEFRGAVPISEQPASEPHGFRTLIAPFKRARL